MTADMHNGYPHYQQSIAIVLLKTGSSSKSGYALKQQSTLEKILHVPTPQDHKICEWWTWGVHAGGTRKGGKEEAEGGGQVKEGKRETKKQKKGRRKQMRNRRMRQRSKRRQIGKQKDEAEKREKANGKQKDAAGKQNQKEGMEKSQRKRWKWGKGKPKGHRKVWLWMYYLAVNKKLSNYAVLHW